MNVFMVYAHQDPTSFGSAMHNRVLSFFEKRGDHVTVSDLYGSGFHAVAAKWDFKVSGGVHQNYMFEQKRSSERDSNSSFAEDIKEEVERLRKADLLVIEFPLWWSAPPAIMKGWFDKVFALGVVWDGDHRYESGLMRGKRALVITGAGDPESCYLSTGIHKATVAQHLYPLLHSTIAHAGMDIVKPFVAYNLTVASDEERRGELEKLDGYLQSFDTNPEFLYKH